VLESRREGPSTTQGASGDGGPHRLDPEPETDEVPSATRLLRRYLTAVITTRTTNKTFAAHPGRHRMDVEHISCDSRILLLSDVSIGGICSRSRRSDGGWRTADGR
jgi:hypothetical protein